MCLLWRPWPPVPSLGEGAAASLTLRLLLIGQARRQGPCEQVLLAFSCSTFLSSRQLKVPPWSPHPPVPGLKAVVLLTPPGFPGRARCERPGFPSWVPISREW